MSNQKQLSSQIPNFTFFDEKWQLNVSNSNSTEPFSALPSDSSPVKVRTENFDDMTFVKQISEANKAPSVTKLDLRDISKKLKRNNSLAQNSARSRLSENIGNKSPLIKRDPSGDNGLIRYSDYVNENTKETKANEKLVKPFDFGKDIPLFDMHVGDIRRKMKCYQILNTVENDETKHYDLNFCDLSHNVNQELKRNKKTDRQNIQIRITKRYNVDHYVEGIREESNKRIHNIMNSLETSKRESFLQDKITKDLEELNFIQNELAIGFEKLQHKSPFNLKTQLAQKLEKTIFGNCRICSTNQEGSPTDRSPQGPIHHLKLSSFAALNSYRGRENSEGLKNKLDDENVAQDPPKGPLDDKIGKKVLSRVIFGHPPSGIKSKHPKQFQEEEIQKPGRINRKYLVPTDQSKGPIDKGASRGWINRSQPTSIEHSYDHKGDNSHSNLSSEVATKENDAKLSELSKFIEISQTIPDKCFVKLTKSYNSADEYMLKFTTAYTSFNVPIKINDTVEVGFTRQLHGTKSTSNISNDDSPASKFPYIGIRKESDTKQLNFDRRNHPNNINLSRKSSINNELESCHECLIKLEGAKLALKKFFEHDEQAWNLDKGNIDKFAALGEAKGITKEKSHSSQTEINNSLKNTCNEIELYLESCFEIAPIHTQKVEKLLQELIFLFEVKLRNHIEAENALLLEFGVEEKIKYQKNTSEELKHKGLYPNLLKTCNLSLILEKILKIENNVK